MCCVSIICSVIRSDGEVEFVGLHVELDAVIVVLFVERRWM